MSPTGTIATLIALASVKLCCNSRAFIVPSVGYPTNQGEKEKEEGDEEMGLIACDCCWLLVYLVRYWQILK